MSSNRCLQTVLHLDGIPDIQDLIWVLNEFNKSNNARARMLDSIYHMTLWLLWNLISAEKKRYTFVIMYATFPENL